MSTQTLTPHVIMPNGIKIPVFVLDVSEMGGVKLVSVQALFGAPFIGGDKQPVRTEYATVEASLIYVQQTAVQAEQDTDDLLELYDRTHVPAALLADEAMEWSDLQGCELAHLGINA